MNKIFSALGLILFFAGCETVNFENLIKNQCANTQWEQQGYNDASAGKKVDQNQLNRCAPHLGTTQFQNEYNTGYQKGVTRFCNQDYGVYWGRQGGGYEGICPQASENSFLAGYSAGKMDYDRLQVEKQKATAFQSMATATNSAIPFPPPQGCYSSINCRVKDRCVQNPSSRFSTDRICEKRPYKSCFSDWDCEVTGDCVDRNCKYKLN